MAIPRAYQLQMKADAVIQKSNKATGDRNNGKSKIARPKSYKLINLKKKRKYVWLGFIYLIIACFFKWNSIVEKWEANAYVFEFPGVSFSVGKKAKASGEKSALDKTAVEKTGLEKPVTGKTATDIPLTGKVPQEGAKTALDQKGKSSDKGESGIGVSSDVSAKAVSDESAKNVVHTNLVAKTQNVATLETDGAGFDPLSTSSPKEVELLLKLASRRKDIENREASLKERELAIAVVEKQVKDKTAELTKLKESIEALLKKTDKNAQEQFTNLVKIYEGMKPKHAAQIFDRMDMTVLKELIPLMSQRKVANILDQMNVAKAKELTLVLIGSKNLFAKSTENAPKK